MLTVVSVLCTGLAFAALLERRYNRWITLAALGGSALLALVLVPVARLLFRHSLLSSAVLANVTLCTVYFVASLFIFRNHLLQKLALTLFAALHISLFSGLSQWLLGMAGLPVTGAAAVLVCCGVYLLLSLIAWLLLHGFFRYFREQRFSPTWLWVVCGVLVLLAVHQGVLDPLLQITRYWPRYALCFLLYGVLLFSMAAAESAGRFAQRRAVLAAREEHLQAKSEYCRSMLVNIEALKDMHKADGAPQSSYLNALFATYSTNPYVSAVIATYAADADLNGVRFEYSNNVTDTRLKTMEICTLLTDTLSAALSAAESSGQEDPFIRLSLSGTEGKTVVEAVYSCSAAPKPALFSKEYFRAAAERFFGGEDPAPQETFADTEYLVSAYGGQFGIAQGKTENIVRVAVNR